MNRRAPSKHQRGQQVGSRTPLNVFDLADGTRAELAFVERAIERGFRSYASDESSANVDNLEKLSGLTEASPVFDSWTRSSESVVMELETSIVWVTLRRYAGSAPSVRIEAFATGRAEARLALALVREVLPEDGDAHGETIEVVFWYQGRGGASSASGRCLHRPGTRLKSTTQRAPSPP